MKESKEPNLFDESKRVKKIKNRKQWWKDNLFNVLNLIIAVLALLVGIAGIFLPKG